MRLATRVAAKVRAVAASAKQENTRRLPEQLSVRIATQAKLALAGLMIVIRVKPGSTRLPVLRSVEIAKLKTAT